MAKFVLTAEAFTLGGPAAPVAPTTSTATTGGTVAAGTYLIAISYVNAAGETAGSGQTSQITTGATSTITINSPSSASNLAANATGWYAYVSQVGGTTLTRQQTPGSPTALGTNLTLTAPPTNTGANPLTVSTAATDVTSFMSKGELQIKVEDKDITNYQSGGWHEHLGGLKQASLILEFFNDFASGAIDSVVFPLLGTVIGFELKGTQAARSATNPSYVGTMLVTDWNPVTGKVGDVDTASVTWPSTAAVVRLTT